MIDIFLKYGEPATQADGSTTANIVTALRNAIKAHDLESVERIANKYGLVSPVTLSYACESQSMPIFMFILNKHKHDTNRTHWRAFANVCWYGTIEMVKLYIEHIKPSWIDCRHGLSELDVLKLYQLRGIVPNEHLVFAGSSEYQEFLDKLEIVRHGLHKHLPLPDSLIDLIIDTY